MFNSQTINQLLEGKTFIKNTIGESSSLVYKIFNLNNFRNGYLKMDTKISSFGVNHEWEVLNFLKGHVKVAYVFYYEYPHLITYELEGEPSFLSLDKNEAVKIIASSLKQLHQIDISQCLIESQFEIEFKDVDLDKDYVFVHGDACLPNFIIKDNKFNGFIDLGSAGVGNRYEDLALCTWSILYNFKNKEYVNLFFEEYGKSYYNLEKISFYLKLQDMNLDVFKDF